MPAASYDRSDIRTVVGRELQDETFAYFTATKLNALINDAMGDWCEMSRLRVVNSQIDIVANQSVYSLSSLSPRCIEILRASCPSGEDMTDDVPLALLTQTEADTMYPNWRSDTASWPHSIIRDLQGPQSLRLYPTPSSSQEATVRDGTYYASQITGGVVNISGLTQAAATAAVGGIVNIQFLLGSLQLYYIAHSTDLSDDSTTVETACGIAPDFQDALVWYVCARCCEADLPIAQANKAALYWAKWQDELAKATQLEKRSFQTRPPRAVRKRFF